MTLWIKNKEFIFLSRKHFFTRGVYCSKRVYKYLMLPVVLQDQAEVLSRWKPVIL